MSSWEASESGGAALPQQSPGPWGHQGGRTLTPTHRTVAGGGQVPGGSLSSRVAGQTPDPYRCLSQNTSLSTDISFSRLWRPEVQDQGAVNSVSGESLLPGWQVGATIWLRAHRARPWFMHTRTPPASSPPKGTNPNLSWPTLTTSSNPTHLQRPTSKHCYTG